MAVKKSCEGIVICQPDHLLFGSFLLRDISYDGKNLVPFPCHNAGFVKIGLRSLLELKLKSLGPPGMKHLFYISIRNTWRFPEEDLTYSAPRQCIGETPKIKALR